MNEKGSGWSHIVASSNRTIELAEPRNGKNYDDDAIVVVISWNEAHAPQALGSVTPNGTRRAGPIRLEGDDKSECGCGS